MATIPKHRSLESGLQFLLDPYRFISVRAKRLNTDIFETRLMFERTICMRGKDAARIFYDEDLFLRQNAAPGWLQKSLFGSGGVQTLDGTAHYHRKKALLKINSPERIQELCRLVDELLMGYVDKWRSLKKVPIYEELQEVLTSAVCRWAEVPLYSNELEQRTRDIALLFDKAAAFPFGHLQARAARKRCETWLEKIIQKVRAGWLEPGEQSALHIIAWHSNLDGRLLDPRIAAVELLNIIRPTVAVSVYGAFIITALEEFPAFRARLDEREFFERFIQEVRRFYPFFPAVMARVKREFEWNGYVFKKGVRVILDLYGTDHDSRHWNNPDKFDPDRFLKIRTCPFSFIPQGGGEAHADHRCAGEFTTIELMKRLLNFLHREINYQLLTSNLELDMRRLPCLPRERLILSKVEQARLPMKEARIAGT